MEKITVSFVIFVFALGFIFVSYRPVDPIIQPQTQVERQLEHSNSTQADQAMEGSQSPSVGNLLKIYGGDLSKPSNPETRARTDVRNAMTNRAKGSKRW